MAALSAERDTPRLTGVEGPVVTYDVAAATKIHAGSIVQLAAGYAAPAAGEAGRVTVGRAEESVDNGSGSAGDKEIRVRVGIFRWANSGGRAVTRAHIGKDGFAEDDQTIGNATNANSVTAGKIVDVDDAGVWVATGIPYI